ncbi:hypothetical protein JCM33774_60650 [Actinophytocola sp. KF-1]
MGLDGVPQAARVVTADRGTRHLQTKGVFRGTPELTSQHLVTWALIVEQWPRLGAALVCAPEAIEGLEQAEPRRQTPGRARSRLGTRTSDVLLRILRDGVPSPRTTPPGPVRTRRRADLTVAERTLTCTLCCGAFDATTPEMTALARMR